MEARKDLTDFPYLNYMFPVMETPSSELREELSFINSVYSFLINIDLNLLVILITRNHTCISITPDLDIF